jgi:4-nitrophenyl phosphatase/phosphoglycolate phosphatase
MRRSGLETALWCKSCQKLEQETLVATDFVFNTSHILEPSTLSSSGAIKGCTGQEPTVVGKPSPLMIDYLEKKYGMDRSRICMVGDRLDTDVLFGTDNGLKSLLVLSGVTSEGKLLSPDNTITPDYYADTINDFFAEVPAAKEA